MKLTLTAKDGHEFGAYRAEPSGTPKAGIVVIQEIFGVNSHIRTVVDSYAKSGYVAIAPQIFDRIKPDLELGYEGSDVVAGRQARMDLGFDAPLLDIQATVDLLISENIPVGVVGYCYGGALAWRSAAKVTDLSATICYYGAAATFKDEAPACPVLLHYGEKDAMIPSSDATLLSGLYPMVEAHVYPADHGFNCDQRASHHAPSAALAMERSLAFLHRHLRA